METEIASEWQLKLKIVESSLYDEQWRKGLLSGLLWEVTTRFVHPKLTALSIDLAPPPDEVLSLLKVWVPSSAALQIKAILDSAFPKNVEVREHGLVVPLVMNVSAHARGASVQRHVALAGLEEGWNHQARGQGDLAFRRIRAENASELSNSRSSEPVHKPVHEPVADDQESFEFSRGKRPSKQTFEHGLLFVLNGIVAHLLGMVAVRRDMSSKSFCGR